MGETSKHEMEIHLHCESTPLVPQPPPHISILMPAYQEGQSIQLAIRRVFETFEKCEFEIEVIVISDGSTDGTVSAVKEMVIPGLSLVVLSRNVGKGKAIRSGFPRAAGEFVAFLDADLDLHPKSLLNFYATIFEPGIDVVVGSKTHPQSKVKYPVIRRMQSRTYRKLSMALGLPRVDTQTGIKIFRRSVLDTVLDQVRTSGFAFDLELLTRCQDFGFKIVEAPIELDYQFSSTVSLKATLNVLYDTLKIALLRKYW